MADRHFKFIPALAAGFMAVALAACGGGSSGDSGGATDTPLTLIAPTITTQPAAQTVTAGDTATFSVTAAGTAPLIYQWQKDSTDISGATSSTYTTPATSSTDNGALYSVVVFNGAGTVTSNQATLTVSAAPGAPAIGTQPASQTVVAGQTASFSVTATGNGPLTYQWKKNGTDISGATASTYTTPVNSSADTGAMYAVNVSNGAGTVTSSTATLTVSAAPGAPVIGTQPANQSVAAGQTAKFTVTATGTGPLTYQWQKNGTDISGATSSTYTTPVTVIGDTGAQYSVVVGNSADKVASSKATLTVTAAPVAPAITTQPANQSVTEGQTATFSVTATGTAPLTYQWKKGGTDISGATSSTYTTPATSNADNAAVFTVVVTNSAGNVTSSNATLTVTAPVPPAITTQPAAQTITAGQTATFSVTATGTGTLSYQWKKNGTDISGANSNTYTTPATVIGDNNAVFTVLVSNSAGNVTSNSATLTVNRYSLVANASGGFYDRTECVKDNSTGLVWEGKTASPATSRLGTDTYTNYDDANSAQKPSGGTYVNPTQTEIDASTNSIGYKNSVNTSALCGYTDWRLPTKDELFGIVASSGSPRIDTTWFPNTQASYYWSSSPSVGYSYYAWYVYFDTGVPGSFGRYFSSYVRLVR